MRKFSLAELLAGSIIPPVLAYWARDVGDLLAKGHEATDIALWVVLSLGVGIFAAAMFVAARRLA
jgi:hypothetical protein